MKTTTIVKQHEGVDIKIVNSEEGLFAYIDDKLADKNTQPFSASIKKPLISFVYPFPSGFHRLNVHARAILFLEVRVMVDGTRI